MILKRRYKLYKRFNVDIWGLNTMYPVLHKFHPMVKFFQEKFDEARGFHRRGFFVYRVDYQRPRIRVKRYKRAFVTRKIIRLYYLTLRFHQFRQLKVKARSMSGFAVANFLLLLEGRILQVLIRFNFIHNIFFGRGFLRTRSVLVNNSIVSYPNTPVFLFDVVFVRREYRMFLKDALLRRLFKKEVFLNVPRYSLVSYALFCGFMYKKPILNDLGFHSKLIDVQRGADFF